MSANCDWEFALDLHRGGAFPQGAPLSKDPKIGISSKRRDTELHKLIYDLLSLVLVLQLARDAFNLATK